MSSSRSQVGFRVNGKPYTVTSSQYPPSTTLLEYLRTSGISTGAKGCCFQGGCGICLVTVSYQDPVTEKAITRSVNSCCLLLYSCKGVDVTTIEGLGDTMTRTHPIQERLAKFGGAQCGYCSPAQVMHMYGLLKNNARPKMKEVEDAFDTTICRCTGYRSILDAMKSFAIDGPGSDGGVVDIEELGQTLCCGRDQQCTPSLCEETDTPLHVLTDRYQWLKPRNLTQLSALLKQFSSQKYRLVFGNTGFGIFQELDVKNYDVLIDLRGVSELYAVDLDEPFHVTLGANLTLTNLKELFATINDPAVPYAQEFADHLQYVASTGIRNLGSWAGNLMLKHLHNDFPSDVFTLLETVKATLNIVDDKGRNKNYLLLDFLSLNMMGKVIVSLQLPKYGNSRNTIIRTFKTSPRLQHSLAHVVSGFNFQIDSGNNYLVERRPGIVIQGISPSLIHASNTEAFLTNKHLADPDVLAEAIRILSTEVEKGTESPVLASLSYRASLAVGHFYKFILGVCKDKTQARYVSGGSDLERPVSSGTHDYGTQDEKIFPVSKPLMKSTAMQLTTGEVKFVGDLHPVQGQLYAGVVLSTRGNARIEKIDPSLALKTPGVVAFVQASDIPGENNWRPRSVDPVPSELFGSGVVDYAGQPLGVIVAESETVAWAAAKLVEVRYTDTGPVIVDILDAIRQKSFFKPLGPYTRGDAQAVLDTAPHRVKGSTTTPEQYHFHLENQVATATPTDLGGVQVMASSQAICYTQEGLAQLLGIPQANVTVETQRLGGGFGGKAIYAIPVAGMAAVAAYKVKRTVTLTMDLQTNMQFQGHRGSYYFEYEVGFDNDGKLLAIVATGYADGGFQFVFESDHFTYFFIESAYFCPNWSWTVQTCKTNKPTCTIMRAPGSSSVIFLMDYMMDHVATYLGKDHLEVRMMNFFQTGQTTLGGLTLENVLIKECVEQLQTDINYAERKQLVDDFNKANRWRKRGLHVMPARYAFVWQILKRNTTVMIYQGDATVSIAHGGIDMGQGINTKAIQVCAYKLGIPMDKIRIAKSSSVINANSDTSSGSSTTDGICHSVIKCCDMLNERLEASRKSLKNPTWEELIRKARLDGVNLTAQYWPTTTDQASYSSYIATCAEVELDVLTGQYLVTQVDYINDCGVSINPELDLGQVEGGFLQGCGYFLLEDVILDPKTGVVLTDGTNTYKPPFPKDVAVKLNIKFLRNVFNPSGVLGSKVVGESGVGMGACVLMALKRAIEAARAEIKLTGWFPFQAPAKVEDIQKACLNDTSTYTLGEPDTGTASSGCTSQ